MRSGIKSVLPAALCALLLFAAASAAPEPPPRCKVCGRAFERGYKSGGDFYCS